jgi:NAD(P)H dehydrogenase (quinone)
MKLVISGASAQIGRMVTEKLLESISPADLTLITRNPSVLSHYSDQGVTVLPGHHGEAETLREGYEGADALLMISSRAGGKRARHNHESIQVAKSVGVKHITYTSCAGAHPSNPTPSSADHLGTEYSLFESGLSFAALRNQTYSDLLYDIIKKQVLPKQRMIMNCLHGGFSPIRRKDIAASAAAIMLSPEKHDRVVYEITGPERFTWPEIIDLASKVWETDLEYVSISTEEMLNIMEKVGIPFKGNPESDIMAQAMGAEELAYQADGYEMGFLDIVSAHVQWITGNKPQTLESVWREMKTDGK